MGHQFDFTDEELVYLNIGMTWLWVESRKELQRENVEANAVQESVKIKALKDKIQEKLGQPAKPTLTENITAWQKRELALDAAVQYKQTTGDGISDTVTIQHNLNGDVFVQVLNTQTYAQAVVVLEHLDANTVKIINTYFDVCTGTKVSAPIPKEGWCVCVTRCT